MNLLRIKIIYPKGFRALNEVKEIFDTIHILTGTPLSNDYLQLWAQIKLLDDGEALGYTHHLYKYKYFYSTDANTYALYPNSNKAIQQKIKHLCYTLPEDLVELPPIEYRDVVYNLPTKLQAQYKVFEIAFYTQLESGEVNALTAATLSMKLRQFVQGRIYDSTRYVHNAHPFKIELLRKLLERHPDEPVLIFTQFQHDNDIILKEIENSELLETTVEQINRWNNGQIQRLVANPKSAGHGLNLQFGGRVYYMVCLHLVI